MFTRLSRIPEIDLTFFKCAAFAITLSPMTGCYAYSTSAHPVDSGSYVILKSAAGGNDVAFLVNSRDTLHIPAVTNVAGQLIATNDERMLVRVESVTRPGTSSPQLAGLSVQGTSIDIPIARSIASIPLTRLSRGEFQLTTRKLQRAKTGLVVGVIALTTVFTLAAIAMRNFTLDLCQGKSTCPYL
jgi:hypothetical protein